jgi:hypothetical protein
MLPTPQIGQYVRSDDYRGKLFVKAVSADLSGVELARRIFALCPGCRIFLLSATELSLIETWSPKPFRRTLLERSTHLRQDER